MRCFFFASLLVAALLSTSSREALAEPVLGADFNMGAPVNGDGDSALGVGFDVRAAYRLGFGPVFVQPELQFGDLSFPGVLNDRVGVLQFSGGGRVGLQGLVQPNVFVHLGYATIDGDGLDGFLIDGGAALDIKVEHISFGGEVGLTDVATDKGFKFVHFGPEAHVLF